MKKVLRKTRHRGITIPAVSLQARVLAFCIGQLFFSFGNPLAFGQDNAIPPGFWLENGLPYIQNFSPKEYGEYPQNWGIAQDERGVMYFANNHGILIYDGVSWRLVKLPNQSLPRSLRLHDGQIYFGGRLELGYLKVEANGELQPVSLLDKIPEKHHDFRDVWSIESTEEGIFFRTYKYLFHWSGNVMSILAASRRFQASSAVHHKYYIQDMGTGLMTLTRDSLRLVPGGEMFAGKSIQAILPYDETRILVGTHSHGLFLSEGRAFVPFSTQADAFLLENELYHGARLAQGLFAFATERGGVVVVDKKGNVCQVLNKRSGLRDEHINYTFVDREGGLWLALDNGLARVETPAPLSRFSAESGIESMVVTIIRHEGILYVGTQQGVYYLDKNVSGKFGYSKFRPVTESLKFCWSFLSVDEQLLVATQQGVARIKDGQAAVLNAELPNPASAPHLHRSHRDSSLVYVARLNGLSALQLIDGRWTNLGRFHGITEFIRSVAEDTGGDLWLGTQVQGVIRVTLNRGGGIADSSDIAVKRFGTAHGLPRDLILPYQIAGRTRFATQKGLRYFDAESQRFPPDSTFGVMFADSSCWIYHLSEDQDGNVWIVAGKGKTAINGVATRKPDGSYVWNQAPFRRLNDIGITNVIYPEPDSVVWFGGSEGVARYHTAAAKAYDHDYAAFIRRVVGITTDSLFYGGNRAPGAGAPLLDFGLNSLRFQFAAPTYDDVSENRFQVKLDGYDAQWSRWSDETRKDYTGLPGGDYVFRVRAINVYGNVSREGEFAFTILPPWYRSWWAYLVYGLLAVGGVALVVKWRVRQLQKRTRELEAIVDARTATVREQAEKLKELDQVKSRFFANISHEFRTPMTLILGPLEDMIAKTKDVSKQEELSLMRRNAKRVLHLINQLLDLSRLESKKLKLRVRQGDLTAFLKGIVMSFASLAEQKDINLTFEPSDGSKPSDGFSDAYFDPDHIEKIFYNLLSNAFKFTPAGGNISVSVREKKPVDSAELKQVEITVADTGVGIPEDRVHHIFDRFYQVDATSTREHEGTGIGLALTRELVELHRGEIKVRSSETEGTTFTVCIPVQKQAFANADLDSSPAAPLTPDLEAPVHPAESQTSDPEPEIKEDAAIILVVDDHADVRSYVRMHLQPTYQVIEAENGETGLNRAIETIPDMIISDVMMPKMDGYQLCEALKTNEKTSHIPVILLTARAGEKDKLAGLETGADDYLTKPFNSKELNVRVDNLIQLRRKLQDRFRKEGLLQPRDIAIPSAEEAFLQKMMDILEKNLENEEFGVESLSVALFMSRRQLQRKIRALTGETPTDFIRSVRLQRAKKLLEQGAGSVSEVAFMVGFGSLPYFSTAFREKFGVPPSGIKAR